MVLAISIHKNKNLLCLLVKEIAMRPNARKFALTLVVFALFALGNAANAQYAYFPKDASINYVESREAIIGSTTFTITPTRKTAQARLSA